jgi:hypothetical protein
MAIARTCAAENSGIVGVAVGFWVMVGLGVRVDVEFGSVCVGIVVGIAVGEVVGRIGNFRPY